MTPEEALKRATAEVEQMTRQQIIDAMVDEFRESCVNQSLSTLKQERIAELAEDYELEDDDVEEA